MALLLKFEYSLYVPDEGLELQKSESCLSFFAFEGQLILSCPNQLTICRVVHACVIVGLNYQSPIRPFLVQDDR